MNRTEEKAFYRLHAFTACMNQSRREFAGLFIHIAISGCG